MTELNGEFKGSVREQIISLGRSIDLLRGDVKELRSDMNCWLLKTNSIRVHVKLLWGGAGAIIATVIAHICKVF